MLRARGKAKRFRKSGGRAAPPKDVSREDVCAGYCIYSDLT
jgi:hypothetical protein